jgi:hypothetical protein
MPFKKGETPEGAIVYEKGQSGNLNGRPVGTKNRSTIAKKVLEMTAIYPDKVFEQLQKQYPEITKSMTIEEMGTIIQADKMIRQKDTVAYRAILDSAYGAPKQEVDMDFKGELVIPAPVIYNTAPPLASNENEIDNV